MVGPSKILTVSYGTFSCTLEGFDDPFSTMRGIAEYFRDLAADDRYFGAEPPTPDAEMLHRIAEKEIHQRVEARVDDNGITLRQLDDQAKAPVDDAVEIAPASAPAPEAAVAPQVVSPAPRAVEVPEQTTAFSGPDSVAAKLARIRSAVSHNDEAVDQSFQEDQHAEEIYATAPISAAFDDVEDLVEESPEETNVPEDSDVEVVEQELSDVEVETAFEQEVTTDDMQLDADEAEETDDEPEDVFSYAEPEAEEEYETEEIASFDLEASDEDAEVTASFQVASADDETGEDPLSAMTDSSSDEDPFVAEDSEQEAGQEPDDSAIARVVKMRRADFDAAVDDGEFEEIEDDVEADELSSEDTYFSFETETVTEIEFVTEEDPVAEVLDVPEEVEIATAEAEAEAEAETADEYEEDTADDGFEMPMFDDHDDPEELELSEHSSEHEQSVEEEADDAEISEEEASFDENMIEAVVDTQDEPVPELSAEDEAELMATLELVQRENDAESRADKEGRALLESKDIEEDGQSVDRILEVTNNEMQETEGTRRRSAIAHLKAAVLATRADKKLSKEREDDEASELNQYRDDLARVVRPSRPNKPSERRMPPLMLVSEQRVDVSDTDVELDPSADAVRPRRVSSVKTAIEASIDNENADMADVPGENIFSDSSSFSDFADRMGASELPDLLEAAAAYASYVEGRPHFSRPQIMKAVQSFSEDKEFTREEGLRSFGQLLRRGKIQKLNRGQFTISQNTRFNPEARAAGE